MQEYECSQCGYRKWERQTLDLMMEMPMYGSFGLNSIMPGMNMMNYVEDSVCPNCGKATTWHPVIKNDNF